MSATFGSINFINAGTVVPVKDTQPLPVTGSLTISGGTIITEPALPANYESGVVSATGTAATEVLAAAGVGVKHYITGIIAANSGTVASSVTIQSDPTGTPRTLTVLENPAGGGSNPQLGSVPLIGDANKAVGFTCGASSTTQSITLIGYKGA